MSANLAFCLGYCQCKVRTLHGDKIVPKAIGVLGNSLSHALSTLCLTQTSEAPLRTSSAERCAKMSLPEQTAVLCGLSFDMDIPCRGSLASPPVSNCQSTVASLTSRASITFGIACTLTRHGWCRNSVVTSFRGRKTVDHVRSFRWLGL